MQSERMIKVQFAKLSKFIQFWKFIQRWRINSLFHVPFVYLYNYATNQHIGKSVKAPVWNKDDLLKADNHIHKLTSSTLQKW